MGAHQFHLPITCMNAGHQHHSHQRGVDEHGQRQSEAEHPHERHMRGDQRGERDRHDQRGRGDDPAGVGHAERDALVVVGLVSPAALTPARTRGSGRPGTPRSPSTGRRRCRTAAPACSPPASRWRSCRTRRDARPGRSTPSRRTPRSATRTLSTSAFSGSTTLPVSRNSSTNMITAIKPEHERQPRRDGVDAVAVDLRGAGHVDRACRRRRYGVQAVELSLRTVREQRGRAVDGEQRTARRAWPVARRRWSARACRRRTCPSERTPPRRRAPETDRRRSRAISFPISPSASGMTIGDGGLGVVGEVACATGRRPGGPTRMSGSTRSSGKPQRTPRNGAPSNTSSATPAKPDWNSATHHAISLTRYQNLARRGRRVGSGRPAEHTADEPAHVERIQPVTEQDDGGGRDHDRGDCGERDGGDARVRERLQEVHREQHHAPPSTARRWWRRTSTVRPADDMVRASASSRLAPSASSSR